MSSPPPEPRDPDPLAARLAELEVACAAKDAFIAAISRELNNPLAPVLLAMERLRAVLPSGNAARLEAAMQLLERATSGFARRTRMLLDLADLTAGTASLSATALDLSTLVTKAASDAAEMARLAGCELVVSVAPGLAASANADAFAQVIGHLLANALRFGAGRPVHVSASRGLAGQMLVCIADQGPGVPADKADHLFALLEQARAPLEPGLGIGLWVSARLVAAMGGTIEVKNMPGSGAHFQVSLPRA